MFSYIKAPAVITNDNFKAEKINVMENGMICIKGTSIEGSIRKMEIISVKW